MHLEHFRLLPLLKNRELDEIYISMFFRSFAFSLVAIFVPLYLLIELSYSFIQVLIFFFILYGLMGVFAPIAGKIASKVGLKHAMLISIPIHLLHYYLLFTLKYGHIHYSIVALVGCLGLSLFWVAFHSDFAKFSDKKGRGQETSIWIAINVISATIAPMIGALIITKTGDFTILFSMVIVIGLVSIIPLLFSKDIHPSSGFSFMKIFHRCNFKEAISLAGAGARTMSNCLWPIFVFMILGTYLKLGGIASLSGFFVAIFAIFSGQLTRKLKNRTIIRMGTIVNSITWFIRAFFKTFLGLFATTFVGLLSFTFADVAFHSRSYTIAKKSHHVLDYIVFREIAYSLGRVVILGVALGVYFILRNNFVQEIAMKNTLISVFVLAGIGVLAMNFY